MPKCFHFPKADLHSFILVRILHFRILFLVFLKKKGLYFSVLIAMIVPFASPRGVHMEFSSREPFFSHHGWVSENVIFLAFRWPLAFFPSYQWRPTFPCAPEVPKERNNFQCFPPRKSYGEAFGEQPAHERGPDFGTDLGGAYLFWTELFFASDTLLALQELFLGGRDKRTRFRVS